jgi:succinate dehydrogenase / fumarate reductase cytochrome b subunit
VLRFYRSTVGKKVLMAATGLIGIGFVVLHVAGNLQAFSGREKLNGYTALLHGPGAELLIFARAVLIVAVVLHVVMAYQLTTIARRARPVAYHERQPQVATLASRTMRWGGVVLFAFIVFHLLHFTTRQIDPAGWRYRTDAAGRYDLYGNVVASFRIWWVSAIYVVAMIALFAHLWHGGWSLGRSMGFVRPSPDPLRHRISVALAVIIWLGFSIVPIAVLWGVIK